MRIVYKYVLLRQNHKSISCYTYPHFHNIIMISSVDCSDWIGTQLEGGLFLKKIWVFEYLNVSHIIYGISDIIRMCFYHSLTYLPLIIFFFKRKPKPFLFSQQAVTVSCVIALQRIALDFFNVYNVSYLSAKYLR